jgi:putative restriction endonuclease
MPGKDLNFYCFHFEKLRRDYRNGGAPHKPILLISLIQAFQQGLYNTTEIKILPELVGLFKSNWNKLVNTNHQCLFTLPFYHMNSEPFWSLTPNIGCEIWVNSKSSMRSFTNLTTAVKYAVIDKELMELFLNKANSELLVQILLEKYFPETKSEFIYENNNYINDIEKQIVEDPMEAYKKRLLQIRQDLDNDAFQEEVYLRSNVFKKEIPKIYNYTCCISGLRIDAINNVSMIDACHIIPFSESYNDTISNGIALSPTLHRAFDRGLISIDNNYKVLINSTFSELNRTPHNIKQFAGMKLLLPENSKYFPSQISLEHHRTRFKF